MGAQFRVSTLVSPWNHVIWKCESRNIVGRTLKTEKSCNYIEFKASRNIVCRTLKTEKSCNYIEFKASRNIVCRTLKTEKSYNYIEFKASKNIVGRTLKTEKSCNYIEFKASSNSLVKFCLQNSLGVLMEKMSSSQPVFIRCIKPNGKKSPKVFEDDYVEAQVRTIIVFYNCVYIFTKCMLIIFVTLATFELV